MSQNISRRSILAACSSLPLLSKLAVGQDRPVYEATVTNLIRGHWMATTCFGLVKWHPRN